MPGRATKELDAVVATGLPGTRLGAHPNEVDVASLGQGRGHVSNRNTPRTPGQRCGKSVQNLGSADPPGEPRLVLGVVGRGGLDDLVEERAGRGEPVDGDRDAVTLVSQVR